MKNKLLTICSQLATNKIDLFVVALGSKKVSPFFEWLNSLPNITHRARILVRIERLREGNLGDVKSIGDGVFELRFHFPPGYRIYFLREGNKVIILLSGGNKSTQRKDIQLAKKIARQIATKSAETQILNLGALTDENRK